jgi:hypothetical protein
MHPIHFTLRESRYTLMTAIKDKSTMQQFNLKIFSNLAQKLSNVTNLKATTVLTSTIMYSDTDCSNTCRTKWICTFSREYLFTNVTECSVGNIFSETDLNVQLGISFQKWI